MGINKAILVGHVGRDPEIRYTPNGTAVAKFSVATTERVKDQDRTEWHRIVAWGRLAEICGEYLSKGRQVYIEGRIQTREWEDRDKNKRVTTEIVASTMQMLGPAPTGEGRAGAGRSSPAANRSGSNDYYGDSRDTAGGELSGSREARPGAGKPAAYPAPGKSNQYGDEAFHSLGPDDYGSPPGSDDDIPF